MVQMHADPFYSVCFYNGRNELYKFNGLNGVVTASLRPHTPDI